MWIHYRYRTCDQFLIAVSTLYISIYIYVHTYIYIHIYMHIMGLVHSYLVGGIPTPLTKYESQLG